MPMNTLNASGQIQSCRLGGIAALLVAIGYAATIPLFMWVGAPPSTGEAWFHYLPGKTAAWWVIVWLMVITDMLYLPVAWALWAALREAAKCLVMAAIICLHLFVALDLAVTWMHHASLLALFQSYSNAADEAHRATYLAAAEYASSIYATPLLTFYIIVIPSFGVLLASIAMMKSGFGVATAWIGIITGVCGMLSLTGLFPLVMANALGAMLWFLLVGTRFLRSGKAPVEDQC